MQFKDHEKIELKDGEDIFSDKAILEFNKIMAIKLSKESHVENIDNEIWYVDPIKGIKTLLVDKDGNDINDLFDVAKVE